MKDMKEGLTSARKADITHVRGPFLVYIARPCEYGGDKYERANYLRPASSDAPGSPEAIRAAFLRFRKYLRADLSHTIATLDAMERHEAGDPKLVDVEGMKRAAYAVDTDAQPGAKVGASLLPHVAHGAASKMMAVVQAVDSGLLPADPGTPWRDTFAADLTPTEKAFFAKGDVGAVNDP
jgi:hypothetical protein